MKCYLINLDRAAERRHAVEEGFARLAPSGWELIRFPAVDAASAPLPLGKLQPGAKACFLSHRELIRSLPDDHGPVLIVEDDVVFCRACFDVFSGLPAGFDLLFGEVLVGSVDEMLRLARLRRHLFTTGEFRMVNLSAVKFSATTAYVLGAGVKPKLLPLLDAARVLDLPYDLAIRHLVKSGRVSAAVAFPFVTSISSRADESQIQSDNPADFLLNAFRRLMFVERDESEVRRADAAIRRAFVDEEAALIATILGAMASPRFPDRHAVLATPGA